MAGVYSAARTVPIPRLLLFCFTTPLPTLDTLGSQGHSTFGNQEVTEVTPRLCVCCDACCHKIILRLYGQEARRAVSL